MIKHARGTQPHTHTPLSPPPFHPAPGKSYRELINLRENVIKDEKPGLLMHFISTGGESKGFAGLLPEWSEAERVIAVRNSRPAKPARGVKGQPAAAAAASTALPSVEYLIKWTGLEYGDATWVAESALTAEDLVGPASLFMCLGWCGKPCSFVLGFG